MHHILGLHVGPNTEQQILPLLGQLHILFQSKVSLACSSPLVLLDLCNFLSGTFAMLLHVLEDVTGDIIVLLEFDLSQFIDVVVAPGKFIHLVHGHGFAGDVLHNGYDLFSCLAVINGLLEGLVWPLAPQGHERGQVALVVWIGQMVACQVFVLQRESDKRWHYLREVALF